MRFNVIKTHCRSQYINLPPEESSAILVIGRIELNFQTGDVIIIYLKCKLLYIYYTQSRNQQHQVNPAGF